MAGQTMGNEFPTPEIAEWVTAWQEARARTYDLLHSLPYAVMNFSPHPEFGTFIRQLRHVGDIQRAYISAIETGAMDFSQTRQRALERSKEDLESYLQALDAHLLTTLRGLSPERLSRSIAWPDARPVALLPHLLRLLEHETLHQGMWVFYAKIADLPLPESWTRAWPVT